MNCVFLENVVGLEDERIFATVKVNIGLGKVLVAGGMPPRGRCPPGGMFPAFLIPGGDAPRFFSDVLGRMSPGADAPRGGKKTNYSSWLIMKRVYTVREWVFLPSGRNAFGRKTAGRKTAGRKTAGRRTAGRNAGARIGCS